MHSLAFDVSHAIEPGSVVGAILKGVFNFSPAKTWLEAIAWWAYVVPVVTLFVRAVRRPGATATTPASTPAARPGPSPQGAPTA